MCKNKEEKQTFKIIFQVLRQFQKFQTCWIEKIVFL